MPRESGIWLRKQTGWYYTTVNGNQVRLARDKAEAGTAYHELMLGLDAAPPTTTRLSFRMLADRFLAHCKRTMAGNTFKVRMYYLQSFCDHVRKKAGADLRVEHVSSWEEQNPHWSQGTVATVRSILIACSRDVSYEAESRMRIAVWSVLVGQLATRPEAVRN